MAENPLIIPQPIRPVSPSPAPLQKPKPAEKETFGDLLQKEIRQAELKFSRHATERLKTRAIRLEQQDLYRLSEAVRKAEAKGCKESLVIMDDLALVVSIRNRTVITAVDGDNRKENVFTNIDSAVIV